MFIAQLVCPEPRLSLQLIYLCSRNLNSGLTHKKLKISSVKTAMVVFQIINVFREPFKNMGIFSTNKKLSWLTKLSEDASTLLHRERKSYSGKEEIFT
jgi:hypothetical protein